MRLDWIEDSYTVVAGDATAAYAARGYNLSTRKWETLSGSQMGRSEWSDYWLYSVLVRVYASGGTGRRGITGQLYVVGDPLATYHRIRLTGGSNLLGGDNYIDWNGRYPMLAGFEWHITYGGLTADDVVYCQIGYGRS